MKPVGVLVIIFIISVGFSYEAFAQIAERVVYFKDKDGTTFSIDRPLEFLTQKSVDRRIKNGISVTEQDLPVNADYTSQLKGLGADILYTIKWFNAAIVKADEATFIAIQNLSFVEKIDKMAIHSDPNRIPKISATCELEDNYTELEISEMTDIKDIEENFNYGNSLAQVQMLGVDKMHQEGFLGQGIHIAVLDGGFFRANTLSAFSHLTIPYVYDVVGNGQNVYQASAHGTKVLSTMAAKVEGEIIGTAPEATYYLFRTEDVSREMPIEEAFWVVGAEKADSLGVDIIQTSLGYYDFDNPVYNYTHEDLDGNTALISRAAQVATQKGIVVVTSAGNSGDDAWRKISFPADAADVLAVGAVDRNRQMGNFSSLGNTVDGRIKPDIMAMGVGTTLWSEQDRLSSGNGTSYAAPLIAGLIAGFIQQNPTLTQQEIMRAIRRAGDKYFTPNSQYGYGIPTFARLNDPTIVLGQSNEDLTEEGNQIRIFPNPIKNSLNIDINEKLFTFNKMLNIQIYNLQGQLILKEVLNTSRKEIEFPNVSKGIYVVRIEGQTYQGTIKILKE